MKRVVLLFALLFQFSLLFAQTTQFVNTKNLNVRQEPSSSGEVITVLHASDSVEVIGEDEDNWVKVRVNDMEGYVSSAYLVGSLSAVKITNNVNTTNEVVAFRKTKEATVYICDSNSAYAYHSSTSCRGLNRCTHGVLNIPKSEAVNDYGRSACKICY